METFEGIVLVLVVLWATAILILSGALVYLVIDFIRDQRLHAHRNRMDQIMRGVRK